MHYLFAFLFIIVGIILPISNASYGKYCLEQMSFKDDKRQRIMQMHYDQESNV